MKQTLNRGFLKWLSSYKQDKRGICNPDKKANCRHPTFSNAWRPHFKYQNLWGAADKEEGNYRKYSNIKWEQEKGGARSIVSGNLTCHVFFFVYFRNTDKSHMLPLTQSTPSLPSLPMLPQFQAMGSPGGSDIPPNNGRFHTSVDWIIFIILAFKFSQVPTLFPNLGKCVSRNEVAKTGKNDVTRALVWNNTWRGLVKGRRLIWLLARVFSLQGAETPECRRKHPNSFRGHMDSHDFCRRRIIN